MTDTSTTSPTAIAGPAFRVGEVFSISWSLFRKYFGVLAGLAVICSAPAVTLAFLADSAAGAGETETGRRFAAIAVYTIIDLLCMCLLWASVTRAGFDALQEEQVSIARAFGTGFDRLLPVAGVLVLTLLAIFGGFVMLVIPGFLLLTSLYVTVPVAVIERRGMMDCLHRSRALSRGSRSEILGVIFLLGCVTVTAPPTPGSSAFSAALYLILTSFQLIGFTFTALVQTVIWHRLRSVRK